MEAPKFVTLIGSVHQTVALKAAVKKPTMYARKIKALARNVLSMMTVTLGAASLEHAHLTLRATMKSWGFHKPRLRSMKRLKLMARREKTSTVLLIGSVLQTVAFWEAAKSLTSCARMIEGWERNVLSMTTATLGAASLEHARLILRATMKAPLLKSNKLKRYPTLSLKKNLKCVE